jgi:hypothetical protein
MNDDQKKSVHYLRDFDGTMQRAYLSVDPTGKHVTIEVPEYGSGTEMYAAAFQLLKSLKRWPKSATLILARSERKMTLPHKRPVA